MNTTQTVALAPMPARITSNAECAQGRCVHTTAGYCPAGHCDIREANRRTTPASVQFLQDLKVRFNHG